MVVRNEARHIGALIAALRGHVDEVLVVDTGSEDDTVVLAKAAGARVLNRPWLGYGATKNDAAAQASHPWILSLDGDEIPDEQALASIVNWRNSQPDLLLAGGWKRITQFGSDWVKHGNWSRDYVWRLYHRDHAAWSLRAVHERLEPKPGTQLKEQLLPGMIRHYSFEHLEDYQRKHEIYAQLGAESLHQEGVQATWIKQHVAPIWRAFRGLVLRGGWRDGAVGWRLAQLDYEHVRMKYKLLSALQKAKNPRP